MATSHHGAFPPADNGPDTKTLQRFLDQINNTARREYPRGRMGGEDDGALSYAVAADPKHGTVVIRFGKPVEWIGLSLEDAERLRDHLTERMLELRGITV